MAAIISARPLGLNTVRTAARAAKPVRQGVRAFAVKAERELWYPGATAPEYLDGSMAGDFGKRGPPSLAALSKAFNKLAPGPTFLRVERWGHSVGVGSGVVWVQAV